MTLTARFEQSGDAAERRGADRRGLRLAISASLPDTPDVAATIHDLSETGLLLETPLPLAPGQTFEAFLPLAGAVETTVVWSSHRFHGCQFARRVPRAAVSAALLKGDPPGPEVERAERNFDVLRQLRDLNDRIEQVGEDLDRTIKQLSETRPGVRTRDPDEVIAAALPKSPMLPPPAETEPSVVETRFYEPVESPVDDAARPVVIVSLIFAGAAALILIAALLEF